MVVKGSFSSALAYSSTSGSSPISRLVWMRTSLSCCPLRHPARSGRRHAGRDRTAHSARRRHLDRDRCSQKGRPRQLWRKHAHCGGTYVVLGAGRVLFEVLQHEVDLPRFLRGAARLLREREHRLVRLGVLDGRHRGRHCRRHKGRHIFAGLFCRPACGGTRHPAYVATAACRTGAWTVETCEEGCPK